ncbi:CCN family member 2-like [Echinops telfairi]|uniref:CCN family member 2 n=1 Tax=Echinops telfairi TaxID=9371 RepID=A0ABM0ZQ95_ECHTE|nr:CCN family member 2-like [Echinops telfairi]
MGSILFSLAFLLAFYSWVSKETPAMATAAGGLRAGKEVGSHLNQAEHPADHHFSLQRATSKGCNGQCQCDRTKEPSCPPGVRVVMDGCNCCRMCAKQLGELCEKQDTCDMIQGLYCDLGTPPNRTIGVCKSVVGAPCELEGKVYQNGETFVLACKLQCTCINRDFYCSMLCPENNDPPSSECPFWRKVKPPGECCEVWACEKPKELTTVSTSLETRQLENTVSPDPTMMRPNCQVRTTEWSACSKTCGMGISTRVTNDNANCTVEKQNRLCIDRPCQAAVEEEIKVS